MVSMTFLTIFAVFAFVIAPKSGLSSVKSFLSASASSCLAYTLLSRCMACKVVERSTMYAKNVYRKVLGSFTLNNGMYTARMVWS